MTPTTHTRNLKIVATAFVVVILLGLLLFAIGKKQISEVQNAKNDSLVYYRDAYNVGLKQFGYKQADFERELEIRDKSDKILRAENIALHERTNLLQGKYSSLLSRIKLTAPIEAQPYIDSLSFECDKVIVSKDSVIGNLSNIIINQDSIVLTQVDLINLQTDQLSKDSVFIGAMNTHINSLRADNKAKDKEIADLKKNNRWQRWRDGLLGFVFGFGAGSAVPRD